MEWSAFLKYLLSGYFDDAADTAWNEYKKGLIDLVIAIVAGVTYLIRMLPLAAIRSKVKSPFVRSFLYYVPYAVLGAMTFPAVFSATGSLTASAIGAAVALVLGWMGKSLLTVAAAACVAALAAGMLLP